MTTAGGGGKYMVLSLECQWMVESTGICRKTFCIRYTWVNGLSWLQWYIVVLWKDDQLEVDMKDEL